jgi:hypothetical protein
MYDPQGEYIRLWCPELSELPTSVLLNRRTIRDVGKEMPWLWQSLPECIKRPVCELRYPGGQSEMNHRSGAEKESRGALQRGGMDITADERRRRTRRPTHGGVPGLGK